MVWVPTVSAEVARVATPLPFTATAGWSEPSMLKVTEPVPTGFAPAVTVAVKVTDEPTCDGVPLETSAVVVVALLTTWLRLPVLPA